MEPISIVQNIMGQLCLYNTDQYASTFLSFKGIVITIDILIVYCDLSLIRLQIKTQKLLNVIPMTHPL